MYSNTVDVVSLCIAYKHTDFFLKTISIQNSGASC